MYTAVQMQFIFGNLSSIEFSLVDKILCNQKYINTSNENKIYIAHEDCITSIISYLHNDFIPTRDVDLLTSILNKIPCNFGGDVVFSKG